MITFDFRAIVKRLFGAKPEAAPIDDHDDDDFDPDPCQLCDGDGYVNCYCGGDLCVCENYGEMICPKCGGGYA